MSIVDKQLIMQIDAPDQIKSAWRAFLKRRKAYILIDWGQVAEAKEFLSTLLDDPLCKDYAKREPQLAIHEGKESISKFSLTSSTMRSMCLFAGSCLCMMPE